MANGEKIPLIGAGDKPPPSSIHILLEGAKLLGRSWKPVLSILLVLLLPYAFLFFGNYLTITPLTVDMVIKFLMMRTKDPGSPEYRQLLAAILQDLRGITGAEAASILVSHLLFLLLVMAMVYVVAMASKGEQVTPKDLLSMMGRTWKGTVVTGLYVVLLSSGYTALVLVLIVVLAFVSNGSAAVIALCGVISALAILLLVYLQVVWYEGLVISVVEEHRYGLAALGRASELIQGRRKLGFTVNFHLTLLSVLFFAAYHFAESLLPRCETVQLAGGFFLLCGGLVINVLLLAVFVVFYCECKKSHGEDVPMRGRLMYTRVPSAPTPTTLDGAIP